jgi:hypothetical protein
MGFVNWFVLCVCVKLRVNIIFGSKIFVLDKHAPDYVQDIWLPLFEDGREVRVILAKG